MLLAFLLLARIMGAHTLCAVNTRLFSFKCASKNVDCRAKSPAREIVSSVALSSNVDDRRLYGMAAFREKPQVMTMMISLRQISNVRSTLGSVRGLLNVNGRLLSLRLSKAAPPGRRSLREIPDFVKKHGRSRPSGVSYSQYKSARYCAVLMIEGAFRLDGLLDGGLLFNHH